MLFFSAAKVCLFHVIQNSVILFHFKLVLFEFKKMNNNKYKNFLTQIIKIERDTYFRDHRLFLKDNIFLIIHFFPSRIDFYYFYVI